MSGARSPNGSPPSGPIAWMAANPVAANLLMVIFVVGGVLMAPKIKQEVIPEVGLGVVTVQVPYPGASPEEVEQGIVLAVEAAARQVDGVDEVESTAAEGLATVRAKLTAGTDSRRALDDIKSNVDRITSFPRDAEDPVVSLATTRRQVMTLVIHGDLPRRTLRQIAESDRDELLARDDISAVELGGLPPPEISIEVPQRQLRRYNLSIPELADRIAASSIELPAGSVNTSGGDVLVRTTEQRKYADQFRDVVVISRPDGTEVTLGELANVRYTFRETGRATYFDGRRAVSIDVFRTGDQSPTEVAGAVHEFVDERNESGSEAVEYAVWNDQTDVYANRVDLLLENAYLGLALVLLTLGIFLQIRVAFWTSVGIAVSFLGAILFMPALGVSLNMVSLFAFILTLGIVVDDAIVVGESIYTARDAYDDSLAASIFGTRDVMTPVAFAVLTTVTAFAPLLFIPGIWGRFLEPIPLIVIPIFLISLVECLYILPAHLAHSRPGGTDGIVGRIDHWQQCVAGWLDEVLENGVRPVVNLALRFRYATIAAAAAIFMITIGLVGGGIVNFEFTQTVQDDEVVAGVRMPVGTPAEQTAEVTDKLVRDARAVIHEIEASSTSDDVTRGILTELGTTIADTQQPRPRYAATKGHLAEVAVSLVPADQRELSAEAFERRWRERVGNIPGADTLRFSHETGPGSDAPVSIELVHTNVDRLRAAADRLADELASYDGVHDVSHSFRRSKEQLELELEPNARSLGLDETMLARQVRGAFFGIEVDRVQYNENELGIFVRRPEEERVSESDVENTVVRTPKGGEIPLDEAAAIHRSRAPMTIEREGGARVVEVTADVDPSVVTGSEVTSDVVSNYLRELSDDFPGLDWERGGLQQQVQKSLVGLAYGYVIALLIMYSLMAVAFRSYVQPLVIMSAIPFGIVGAVFGHLLMGYDISLLSFLGFVALSGVVVNNALVLISLMNELRDEGRPPFRAAVEGVTKRCRPIVLTSLTTFFGLVPMIFESSLQARFLIPMALSLGFGVLFVTAISLLLVPSLYVAITDIKSFLGTRPDADQS